ncbi:hypothetical protein [Candidatus Marithrix sp. Canyon 246]|uniref:hypothetical protein n=1 Tax=Candidatus Marithrix sp. Canyon 246 TaxID=1827136 RepID=UPI00084A2908|nr:hypothetical protein [Candidatus Marithrix sp. Canyon 246]
MSQSVCLYSELEPYSGSISHNPSDLPRLIRHLIYACLFYDVVVVHRRNVLEHPLTLPAFEILKPFVQCGQLWTSANESDGSPENYLEQKTQELKDFFNSDYVKKISAVDNIKDRWLDIIPAEWKITRNANDQANWVLKNINDYLYKYQNNKSLFPLLDAVQNMQDFNKEKTLAILANLRGKIYPADLSEIANLIQTQFIRAGAKFNNNAVIYPGNLYLVKERIKHMDLNLDRLINNLSVKDLCEVAHDQKWLMIRNALLNNILYKEIQQEIYSIFNSKQSFPKQVEELLKMSEVLPICMPSSWALVSQSLLGTAHAAAKDEVGKIFILDLDHRVIYEKNSANSPVKLGLQQTNLLSILVIAGKLGLTVEHIKQWLIELDAFKKEKLKWKSQAELNPKYHEKFFELRNRIDGLKRDINKKLKPLGLRIGGEKGKGIWYLETYNSDQDFVIKLYNSVWGEFFEKKETNYTPQGLSKQSKLIWQCLWKFSPNPIHAKKLAEILEKEWNENTPKQIYKSVYKLKLRLNNEPWMIKHSYLGEYVLVPRLEHW